MSWLTLHAKAAARQAMFFEGSEKKLEIVMRPGARLRQMGESFWQQVVEAAGAKILSKISNDSVDSYLLSESSLFVWDEQITMITCGQTTLAHAILFFLEHVSLDDVATLIYERKNEFYPHRQQTDFFNDVKLLKLRIPGTAYRFGSADDHHLFLFHLNREYRPWPHDCTLELLMYNLQGPARDVFSCSNQSLESIRRLTKVHEIFPGFTMDEHLFQPCGYSLNAIRGPAYYTVHVTPEETGSYVSFETNIEMGDRLDEGLNHILEVFQPQSFDVVWFRPDHQLKPLNVPGFTLRDFVKQSLSCGYEVGFSSFFIQPQHPRRAFNLEAIP